jgi:hypothetical protein
MLGSATSASGIFMRNLIGAPQGMLSEH